jgi:hypothetical protein
VFRIIIVKSSDYFLGETAIPPSARAEEGQGAWMIDAREAGSSQLIRLPGRGASLLGGSRGLWEWGVSSKESVKK